MPLFDKKIFEKYADAFEAFAEYGLAGRLPKLNYKKRIDITIDAKLLRQLKEHCKINGMKLSQLIEKRMRGILAG